MATLNRRTHMLTTVTILAVTLLLLGTTARPATAQDNPQPDQPLLCFMNQGNEDRTLTLVPARPDNATHYDVATGYNPADDTFTLVETFALNTALNTKVESVAHWVRSRNAAESSDWLRCDSYRKISSVSVENLIDFRSSNAHVAVGLDGNGTTPVSGPYRVFEGQHDDVVVVDVANRAGLAPNGKQMAWRARFRLAEADVQALYASPDGSVSWNIMQRGLASDPGGQWKMSLLKTGGKILVQCVTQDGRPGGIDRQSQVSPVDIGALPITNGFTQWITATCFSDDSGNAQDANGMRGDSLQAVVNGNASDRKIFPEGVGEFINPSSTNQCANGIPLAADFNKGIGYVYTAGNKPFCDGSPLGDDLFKGHLDHVEVFKQ